MIHPLELYIDEECTQQIAEYDGSYQLDFGRIDSGQSKISIFFIKNHTAGIAEDVEIEVSNISKEGVMITPVKPEHNRRNLESLEVWKILMSIDASKTAKAGKITANLTLKAMLTEE